ncbi:hypothetical protein Pla52n_64410 [Stieleria varia]|uniref:Uncharacterized protein n=1 Tax=Stieleria varia TaxID=2528005 RepID=A0A5C5ZY76_9BACT|nr:hypothetical protein Pla52n_64410 [Stieleria varia]
MKADDEIGCAEELRDEIDEQLRTHGKIHKKTFRKIV